jgi:hypothetical protein
MGATRSGTRNEVRMLERKRNGGRSDGSSLPEHPDFYYVFVAVATVLKCYLVIT